MEKCSSHDGSPSTVNGLGDDLTSNPSLASITRKVDYHIVPLMLVCYFLQFLDKVIINYANIMGLSDSLEMQGNDFPWLATAFFIGYAVAEFPQGYLIQKFPVSKVLGINVTLWGVSICCTAAAQNFPGIAAARTVLGMLEAVITPSLIMVTSQWYTRRQATPRTGIWYCGLGIGQTIGGLISYAAQHGSATSSFESWRIMFLAVGAFNLTIGLIVTFRMPSGIDRARFLTEQEKVMLENALWEDQAGNGRKVFLKSGIREAITDSQVWILFLMTILIVIPSGVITTFSATLILGFGYTSKEAALLNMPSGVISIIATILGTFAILRNFPRWLAICLLKVPALVGAGLMSFYSESQAGSLAGIYLVNFDAAPLALIFALVGANVQGYTKKVTTNALVAVAFSIANIVGPQTFQGKDAPEYIPAKITLLCVGGTTMALSVGLRVLYGQRNRKREESLGATRVVDNGEAVMDLTDRTNPSFVYVY